METKTITIRELKKLVEKGELRESHTSYFRGYVSRKSPPDIAVEYHGRFGHGYTVARPNWQSTTYSFVTYYIR